MHQCGVVELAYDFVSEGSIPQDPGDLIPFNGCSP